MSNYDPADPNKVVLKFPSVGLEWKAEVLFGHPTTHVTVYVVKMEPHGRTRIDLEFDNAELGEALNSFVMLERIIIHRVIEEFFFAYLTEEK